MIGNTETSANVMKFQRFMNHEGLGPAATATRIVILHITLKGNGI